VQRRGDAWPYQLTRALAAGRVCPPRRASEMTPQQKLPAGYPHRPQTTGRLDVGKLASTRGL